VEFTTIGARKNINPFSKALSAAPYYCHDFVKNSEKKNDSGTSANRVPSVLAAEFRPTAQPFFPSHKQGDLQSMSSFGGAYGVPAFSESLTLNDGTTAQGNNVSNWKTTAPEFVPKGLNHLAAQGQLPSQLSHLPVNATAETAFLKLTFRHNIACSMTVGSNSYLENENGITGI